MVERRPGQDSFSLRARADATVQRGVSMLKEVLLEAIQQIPQLPPVLPDSPLEGMEVEPREMESPERGPIIVCPDGELYEMTVRMTFSTVGLQEYSDRREELTPLDVPLHEYITYLYSAVVTVTDYLYQQEQRES